MSDAHTDIAVVLHYVRVAVAVCDVALRAQPVVPHETPPHLAAHLSNARMPLGVLRFMALCHGCWSRRLGELDDEARRYGGVEHLEAKERKRLATLRRAIVDFERVASVVTNEHTTASVVDASLVQPLQALFFCLLSHCHLLYDVVLQRTHALRMPAHEPFEAGALGRFIFPGLMALTDAMLACDVDLDEFFSRVRVMLQTGTLLTLDTFAPYVYDQTDDDNNNNNNNNNNTTKTPPQNSLS